MVTISPNGGFITGFTSIMFNRTSHPRFGDSTKLCACARIARRKIDARKNQWCEGLGVGGMIYLLVVPGSSFGYGSKPKGPWGTIHLYQLWCWCTGVLIQHHMKNTMKPWFPMENWGPVNQRLAGRDEDPAVEAPQNSKSLIRIYIYICVSI